MLVYTSQLRPPYCWHVCWLLLLPYQRWHSRWQRKNTPPSLVVSGGLHTPAGHAYFRHAFLQPLNAALQCTQACPLSALLFVAAKDSAMQAVRCLPVLTVVSRSNCLSAQGCCQHILSTSWLCVLVCYAGLNFQQTIAEACAAEEDSPNGDEAAASLLPSGTLAAMMPGMDSVYGMPGELSHVLRVKYVRRTHSSFPW